MFGLTPALTRIVLIIVGLLVIIALTLGYCSQRDKAKRSATQAEIAQAQAGLGREALDKEGAINTSERENSAQTEKNRQDIEGATNAKDSAGDAGERGLRALCQRVQYRSDPRCAGL